MRGAGRLAASSGLRAGAGLVTLAGQGDVVAADSVMTRRIDSIADLRAVIAHKSAIVIGPGLGAADPARLWVSEVLASGIPAVFDADALNLFARTPEAFAAATAPVVITPHPGEAARLLDTTVVAVEADRLAVARAIAKLTRVVVVLKGARTIVCDGDFCAINPTGGPSLGTAGSGDVLAGTISALLAQRLPARDAACVGSYVHGRAGDELCSRHGARGVVSSDLPEAIATVIRDLRP
jgi:ADP-dependent NAD(P)H-hydrate dehydratase / NAD(P)H-hydrate epimerase